MDYIRTSQEALKLFKQQKELASMKDELPLLHEAIIREDLRKVRKRISLKTIDQFDKKGRSPLMLATLKDNFRIFRLLMTSGASIFRCNKFGQTVLHVAALRTNVDIILCLIEHGGMELMTVRDYFGRSALHYAATNYNVQVLVTILKKGKTLVNIIDDNANTPLHYAVMRRNVRAINVLLRYGANLNSRSISGSTPLDIARKMGGDLCQLMEKYCMTPEKEGTEAELFDNSGYESNMKAINYESIHNFSVKSIDQAESERQHTISANTIAANASNKLEKITEKVKMENYEDEQNLLSRRSVTETSKQIMRQEDGRSTVASLKSEQCPVREYRMQADEFYQSAVSKKSDMERNRSAVINNDFYEIYAKQCSDHATKYAIGNGYESVPMDITSKAADSAIDWKNVSDDENKIYTRKTSNFNINSIGRNRSDEVRAESRTEKAIPSYPFDDYKCGSSICGLSGNIAEKDFVNNNDKPFEYNKNEQKSNASQSDLNEQSPSESVNSESTEADHTYSEILFPRIGVNSLSDSCILAYDKHISMNPFEQESSSDSDVPQIDGEIVAAKKYNDDKYWFVLKYLNENRENVSHREESMTDITQRTYTLNRSEELQRIYKSITGDFEMQPPSPNYATYDEENIRIDKFSYSNSKLYAVSLDDTGDPIASGSMTANVIADGEPMKYPHNPRTASILHSSRRNSSVFQTYESFNLSLSTDSSCSSDRKLEMQNRLKKLLKEGMKDCDDKSRESL